MVKQKKSKIRYKTPSSELSAMAAPTQVSSIRASIGLEGVSGDLYSIKVEQLIPYKKQARKRFNQEEIDALAQTIKEHGIRQPLTVIRCPENDGKYQVISGERRLKAAIQVGLSKVPCIVLQDASKANEIALIENLHRTDLHPIEMAEAYSGLLSSGICTSQQEVADKLSLKKSTVSEVLKLDTLPAEVKTYLLESDIKSRDLLRRLVALRSKEEMKSLLKMNDPVAKPSKSPTMKSASILRITLSEGVYKVQKKAMSVLNYEQKKVLKEKLLEIIAQL
ncbi:MAG: ParB/RepB/Spo0J family partition protein [Alphaproteobacteria bacterium]|nr:ParB/RepB/Spo0J family partition protein [Alphaproteobacteria bacterium]